jgi:hypothetical protein
VRGLPERFFPKPVELTEAEQTKAKLARIDAAEQYFKAIGAKVKHGGGSAFYNIDVRLHSDAGVRQVPQRRITITPQKLTSTVTGPGDDSA